MSNNITIELCAEDRARLDRLIAAMERKTCESCVATAMEYARQQPAETKETVEPPKNAPGATEDVTPPTTHAAEEKPTREEDAPWEQATEPTITKEEMQQKVTQLAAANNGAKKAKVREIVNAYAKKVSDLPEDKYPEIWAKLTALESEN
jgi:sRNA-binding protein